MQTNYLTFGDIQEELSQISKLMQVFMWEIETIPNAETLNTSKNFSAHALVHSINHYKPVLTSAMRQVNRLMQEVEAKIEIDSK